MSFVLYEVNLTLPYSHKQLHKHLDGALGSLPANRSFVHKWAATQTKPLCQHALVEGRGNSCG